MSSYAARRIGSSTIPIDVTSAVYFRLFNVIISNSDVDRHVGTPNLDKVLL